MPHTQNHIIIKYIERHYIRVCVCVCALSCVQLFVTPWTVTCQTPLFTGFFKQDYWSGLPFPPPGDFPNSGIKPMSPILAGRFLTNCIAWEALTYIWLYINISACIYVYTPASWITALLWQRGLCNSMKLRAMLSRATQSGWVIVRSSDQMWSTGARGILAWRIPWTWGMKSMKRQNDTMVEDEHPQVKKVSKMLLGKSGRQLLHEFEQNSGR